MSSLNECASHLALFLIALANLHVEEFPLAHTRHVALRLRLRLRLSTEYEIVKYAVDNDNIRISILDFKIAKACIHILFGANNLGGNF